MKGTIVVTGAAGFIGRNLVAALNRRGIRNLLLVDRLGTDEKWRNLRGLDFEDLIAPEKLPGRVAQAGRGEFAGILHMGACSATTERDAGYLWENNYHYTRTLCTEALSNDIRFIYASSAATYGDGSLGYKDEVAELGDLRPLNMYGYSKHAFDLWAHRTKLLSRIVGLKYFNVFGPFEDHKGEMRSLVHKAYGQILEHGSISLFRSDHPDFHDGEQRRDFIYVRDVVDVTLHFLDHPDRNGLYNCGSGQANTWLSLAHALFSAMNRTPDIRFIDMPEHLKGRYQYFTEARIEKLRKEGGYTRPMTPLNEAVRDYVDSHLATENSSYGLM